ncbi:MAG: Ig-like domain repeat protein [Methanobacteriaceae archaeon]|nr:Ig-like domain repeat protein [Methanobacteriaceae archaeon]
MDNGACDYKSTYTIKATIKDSNNKLITTGTVIFKINGKTLATVTVKNGIATYNYDTSTLTSKTYDITTIYSENNQYNRAETTSTLTIKTPTTISINSYQTYAGNKITITATIRDSKGTLIQTGVVSFKINDNTIAQVSVSNGIAKYTYTVPNWKFGNYKLSAVYGSNNNYMRSSDSAVLTLLQQNTKVTVVEKTSANGYKVIFQAKVFTTSGTPITYGKVVFKINGKTIGSASVKNGLAELAYIVPDAFKDSTYTISAIYGENDYAKSSTNTNKLNIGTAYSLNDIYKASTTIKNYLTNNNKLPTTVTINGNSLTMSEYLYLVTNALITGKAVILFKANNPSSVNSEDLNTGKFVKEEYISILKKVQSYYETNDKAPTNMTTSLGTIGFNSLVYLFARIANYKSINNALPGSVDMISYNDIAIDVPDALKAYIQETKLCEVTNSKIVALSASLTAGKTTVYDKAMSIFAYVRDKISYMYSYYAKNGAVKTLAIGSGNCVDQANLLVALLRAAKIPTRYVYGMCTFSSGRMTHMWTQIYMDGKWYILDPTSRRNGFNTVNNWHSGTITGIYIQPSWF